MNPSNEEQPASSSEEASNKLADLLETKYIVQPDSVISSFSLQVIIPLVGPPSLRGKRGIAPVQAGGRLLLYDTVPLGKDRIQVILTLHADKDETCHRVIGQLAGRSLPQAIKACLRVGERSYETEARNGRFEIPNITFDDGVQELSFSMMTLDRVE